MSYLKEEGLEFTNGTRMTQLQRPMTIASNQNKITLKYILGLKRDNILGLPWDKQRDALRIDILYIANV